ncbi:MAG: PLP-dependent transferase [Bacteroidales bacterium]|jgi:O-acetylhomoserine (thiol)-lyase|nr:PLP-dependent transferase [Bacteroidales bacterium]
MEQNKRFATKIIRASAYPDSFGAINIPVYRNAAFEFEDSESMAAAFQYRYDRHTYSRISNPTVSNFEAKLKAASGAETVMSFASGMAAITGTLLTIARAGKNIVSSPHLFGNTLSLLRFTLQEFGIETRFVNTDHLDEIAAAIDDNTCAFFAEIITNPHLEIANLPEISKILKEKNVPMVIDTTVVPWCGYDAEMCGIDIEVVSTTKYISGGATGIGGAVVDYGRFDWKRNPKLSAVPKPKGMSRFMFKLRSEIARNLGACITPDTSWMHSLGLETLQIRYEKMSANAHTLAQFLCNCEQATKVNYPNLDNAPYKKISDLIFNGNPGAMLTFHLPDKVACFRFMDRLKIIRRATNLFDNKTLVIHPESTIYGTFGKEMKELAGVSPTLIRLSAGLEDANDLIDDVKQALE